MDNNRSTALYSLEDIPDEQREQVRAERREIRRKKLSSLMASYYQIHRQDDDKRPIVLRIVSGRAMKRSGEEKMKFPKTLGELETGLGGIESKATRIGEFQTRLGGIKTKATRLGGNETKAGSRSQTFGLFPSGSLDRKANKGSIRLDTDG